MNFWTAAVIIVAIWGFVQLRTARHDRHMGVVRDEDGNPVPLPRPDTGSQREIQELRERVKVLERIVTDEREPKRLASEIENLRDK